MLSFENVLWDAKWIIKGLRLSVSEKGRLWVSSYFYILVLICLRNCIHFFLMILYSVSHGNYFWNPKMREHRKDCVHLRVRQMKISKYRCYRIYYFKCTVELSWGIRNTGSIPYQGKSYHCIYSLNLVPLCAYLFSETETHFNNKITLIHYNISV